MSTTTVSQTTGFIGLFKQHPLFRFTFSASIVLIVLMVVLPIWKLAPGLFDQQAMPLHYNVYFGIDLIGPWYKILYLPMLGTVLLVANTMFETMLYTQERVLSYFFSFGSLFAELVLFVAVVLIVSINV